MFTCRRNRSLLAEWARTHTSSIREQEPSTRQNKTKQNLPARVGMELMDFGTCKYLWWEVLWGRSLTWWESLSRNFGHC